MTTRSPPAELTRSQRCKTSIEAAIWQRRRRVCGGEVEEGGGGDEAWASPLGEFGVREIGKKTFMDHRRKIVTTKAHLKRPMGFWGPVIYRAFLKNTDFLYFI